MINISDNKSSLLFSIVSFESLTVYLDVVAQVDGFLNSHHLSP